MIKLIATDIDGTLVKDGSLLIDPEYMSVIDRLIDKGIIFVVCSGRQFSSEFKLFAPIKHKLLYITDGGTVVRTPKEILKTYPMDEDIWKGMCRMVRDKLLHAITLLLLLISALQRMVAAQSFICFVIHTALRCVRLMTSQGLTEMTSSNSLSFIPTNAKSCVHRFSFRHGIKKAHLAAAGKEWVDCNAKGVSKWTALSYLIDRFDLLPDEVCCFGDNLNDIEMLQNAGISYAVSNARQEVIAAAKHTCAPYWENGVLSVLKSFL